MAERRENPSNLPPDKPAPEVRPPAPHLDGPLGSSGAAPERPPVEKVPAVEKAPAVEKPPAVDKPPTATEAPVKGPARKPAVRKSAAKASPGAKPDPAAAAAPTKADPTATTAPTKPDPTAAPTKPDPAAAATSTEPATATAETPTTPEPATATAEAAAKPAPATATAETPTTPAPADQAGATPKPAKAAPATTAEPTSGAAQPAAEAGAGDTKVEKDVKIDLDKPVEVTTAAASGRRVTRVLRHANPIRAAKSATRTTHAWAKRPTGRLLVPAIAAVLLIGIAGTAGAYLVPKALESGSAPSARPNFPLDQAAGEPSAPSGAAIPGVPTSGFSNPVTPGTNVGGARPADALQGWAQGVGTRVGIPVVAVQAYGYAELVAARTAPNCHLSWTTVAAIAKVESSHGSANGAVLGADGSVQPPIFGLPLDGKGGRQLIRDTDQGAIDGDATYDKAVGPLQFIPATWKTMQVDADNSGFPDPNDIDDAALAAALYLCQGGRDMSKADAWWEAILSYNAVRPYAQKVFEAANDYGQRSRV